MGIKYKGGDKVVQPAIVVVGYNRPDSLSRLLESVGNANYKCDDITLIISIDKSDAEFKIKSIAEQFQWLYGEKIVRTFERRQGLKNHILQCGDLSKKYGAVIILEDDLYVAPDFYNYTFEAVNFYGDNEKVAGIGLYSHEWNGYANLPFQKRVGNSDVFAGQFSITWGQCWTCSQWTAFRLWLQDHETFEYCDYIPERINRWSEQSWGKFFVKYIVDSDKYYIIPNYSMSTNYSDAGQHSRETNTTHQVQLWEKRDTPYMFLDFDELIRYDIFFEPSLNTKDLFGISKEEIDIDLNCTKNRKNTKRYLLTTEKKPYQIVKSYSLSLRPVELNVIYQKEGKGIYLYDTLTRGRKPSEKRTNCLSYYLRGFDFLQLIPYIWTNAACIFQIKINLMKKKIKKKISDWLLKD